jgi:X-Pro dipeptidyl-peptidase
VFRTAPFACLLLLVSAACAASGEVSTGELAIEVEDGATQPVYKLADAIRESVFVESSIDSDGDGTPDRIALDILRPNATGKVASVMEASPYYGLFPEENRSVPYRQLGWYSGFFVPRGYAVVEVEMQGTSRSTGCPMSGGKEDTASVKAAIDWLNGRARGFDATGREVSATWSTGAVGLIGVSYDGTLPIAVAAEGIDGLKTIVPIAAISSWYDYARDYGLSYPIWASRYPAFLADYVVSSAQSSKCASAIQQLGDSAADDTGDYTPFWEERDYRKKLDRITASVFIAHGLRDWNVKPNNFARLWSGLAERNIPRKIWLHDQGHTDAVSLRPTEWRDEMHHWMDHWLYGIENGVLESPRATIQRPNGTWETHGDWPETGTEMTTFVPLGRELRQTGASTPETQTFTDDPTKNEGDLVDSPETRASFRLAWTTEQLTTPLRVSGTAHVHVVAEIDSVSTPLTALLVDYGNQMTAPPIDFTTEQLFGMSCTFEDLVHRTGCAGIQPQPRLAVAQRLVTRGSIDAKNRTSIAEAQPLTPGTTYEIDWDLHATDYVFAAGHQLGLVLSANDRDYVTIDPKASTIAVKTDQTKIILPIAR